MHFLRKYLYVFLLSGVLLLALATAAGYRHQSVETFAGLPYLRQAHAWADSVLNTLTPEQQASMCLLVKPYSDASSPSHFEEPAFTPLMGAGVNALTFPDLLTLQAIPQEERGLLIQNFARQAPALGINLVLIQPFSSEGVSMEFLQHSLEELTPLADSRLLLGMAIHDEAGNGSHDYLQLLQSQGIGLLYLTDPSESFLAQVRQHFTGLILADLQDADQNESAVKTLLKAGADILVSKRQDAPWIQAAVADLLREGDLDLQGLRKQLMAIRWAGPGKAFAADRYELAALRRQVAEASQILVRNMHNLIPFTRLSEKTFFQVTVGYSAPSFEAQVQLYAPTQHALLARAANGNLPPLPLSWLEQFQPVILAVNDPQLSPQRDSAFFHSLTVLAEKTQVVIVNLGPANALASFEAFPTLVQAGSQEPDLQDLPAQLLFGGVAARGQLPIGNGKTLLRGMGQSSSRSRMGYTLPEQVGLRSGNLSYIDSVLQEGIREHAFPGGQVLVALGGKVVYHKAFGYHTYDRERQVQLDDLYDIASITKVAGTTLAAMGMFEEEKLSLDAELGEYFQNTEINLNAPLEELTLLPDTVLLHQLPDSVKAWLRSQTGDDSASFHFALASNSDSTESQVNMKHSWRQLSDSVFVYYRPEVRVISRTSNIFHVKIAELLTHHSGLPPALPIQPYIAYRDSGEARFVRYYRPQANDSFRVEVARDFYLRKDYQDSLWKAVKYLKRSPKPRYAYSDVNLFLLQQAIDSLNQEPISQYLHRRFYSGLGLQTMRYRPFMSVASARIAPTAFDGGWRGQQLRGYVHDPTAALFGGVAGNAGLFSNANDLAVLFQMLLNEGSYGGEEFLHPQTIKQFTEVQAGHRGYGFDKLPSDGYYLVSSMSSNASYGHTGFTGTVIWVDPEYQLVYVFLSNRVYPSEKNWRINTLGIRRQIHDVIYNSIGIGMR